MNIMTDVVGFYIYEVPILLIRTLKNLIGYTIRKSGFFDIVNSLFSPLFGQSSLWSRISGFFLRSMFIGVVLVSGVITFILVVFSIYVTIFIIYYMVTEAFLLVILIPVMLLTLRYYYALTHPVMLGKHIHSLTDAKKASYENGARIIEYLESGKFDRLHNDLIDNHNILKFINRTEITPDNIHSFIAENLSKIDNDILVQNLLNLVKYSGAKYIDLEIIFTGILISLPGINDFLELNGFSQEYLRDTLRYVVSIKPKSNSFWDEDYIFPPNAGIDRSWSLGYSGITNKFSEDFTKQAIDGKKVKIIGRDEVKLELIDILSKSSRKNALIVGEPGSGKTTFVRGLASEIAEAKVPATLKNKRIISLEIGKLFSASFSEINLILTSIIKEIKSNKNIILFIDEIQNIVANGSSDPSHSFILSTLEPYLSEGGIQFIGAVTQQNYVRYIEPNSSIAKSFSLVKLRETNYEETRRLLELKGKSIEKSGIVVTYPAMVSSIDLSKKFIHTSVLPDKALDLLDQAASRIKLTNVKVLDKTVIEKIISDNFGVPVSNISSSESDKLLNLEAILHERVIGQSFAINAIVKALKRARVNVRDDKKPIASFLFCGPTGVGKTETAKSLAKVYYGSENLMVRLDMSEYQDSYSVKRLIGDEFGNIGVLTSKVKSKPYSLILIDEIEKAHRNVLNAFLQVLDDGRLTDFSGVTVDFSNTLLIFTSNVGSKEIFENLKYLQDADVSEVALKSLETYYPPEFLNRFTRVIVYKPLDESAIVEIVKLKLRQVAQKMYEIKKVRLHFTPSTIAGLASDGFSKEYGARSVNRVVEDKVETFLADKILRGELKTGDTITI